MPESPVHAKLKIAAERWLREERKCWITLVESEVPEKFIDQGKAIRPDVIGWIGSGRFSGLPVEVECEPDKRGLDDEMRKWHRISPQYGVSCFRWMLVPDDSDVETHFVDAPWGVLRYRDGGDIRIAREAERFNLSKSTSGFFYGWDRHAESLLLQHAVRNLQREAGTTAQQARPSQRSWLSATDRERVKKIVSDARQAYPRHVAREISVGTKNRPGTVASWITRDVERGLIEGLTYDGPGGMLRTASKR